LCDRSPRTTPFQRPEWLLAWLRAFRPATPWILAVRREGRLAALAPFLLYPKDGERTVAFCGGGLSDYLDVVTDPETEDEATAALLGHLAARRKSWDACDFEPVPGESPLLRVDPPDGFRARTEPRDVCPVLLPEAIHTRQLANLRKYRRKAEALGKLELKTADEGSWEEMLDVLLRLHGARRSPLGPDALAFHRDVAAGFQGRGALGLYILRLDGDPLAALYGFRERDTFCCYMQGFDPEHAKLSPGVMIVGSVIEDAIRRGMRRIDFLRGRESYKYWWGATDEATYRRTISPPRNNPAPGA
ncbi:MAG: GNAT family N-acetyltransferase, partial [Thermoanaerobaculia bacterium]